MDVGEYVFYPSHGVAKITGEQSQEIAGEQLDLFVLELHLGGGRLMIPRAGVENESMRPLVSATKAKRLLSKMRKKTEIDTQLDWKARANQAAEELKKGDAESYTAVLRDLITRSREGKLTVTEERIFDTAKRYFVSEIGVVLEKSMEELYQDIAKASERAE